MFPPLQIVPGFACSVASLDRFRGHQLPGHQSFRNDALANNLFGQGRPSAWFARLETIPNTPPPNSSCDRKNKSSQILKITCAYDFGYAIVICQPGPIPGPLIARTPKLRQECPCKQFAWPRQTVNMDCAACLAPLNFRGQRRSGVFGPVRPSTI